MRRNLFQRLERLEARCVPAVKPLDFTIHFIGSDGAVVQALFLRGGQQIWEPPRSDIAPGPEGGTSGQSRFVKT